MEETPDKNRISAVSHCNLEDSPVFQYINGLSPIETAKAEHAAHVFHSLALPSSLFSSPQMEESYRDSRFLIKRHPSLDLSSPVPVLGETVKNSPDVLKRCQVKLAIELANSLRAGEDGQIVSSDDEVEVVVPMDAVNEISRNQSDELCRQANALDADSDMVFQTEDMESQHGCSVAVAGGGAPDPTLSSSSNVAAIGSTAKAEDKEETCQQLSGKQRSVRRRCLTFDVGGSNKRAPLRDSTNDLPLDFTSSPQKCVDSSKQKTDEILPVPLTSNDGCVLSHAEEEFTTPVSTIRDVVSCDNQISEEASERSMEGEWVEELGSCKRCRCKRSKCLKLYCDCFAAGLYCVEPCSCQDCFNRPIHEDIVIKSRRNVEARNPLAFAPKVVFTSASATCFGEESNKTPASARHINGCNCKKSACLKKYCECYLMGVGCSASCRCIGCKNVPCQTNEQFHFPCPVESGAVTINEEAKDHCNYI